jgi:hypothetical protein
MKIDLVVGAVSGESAEFKNVALPQDGLLFLLEKDHEGSSVSVNIQCEHSEEAYQVLRSIAAGDLKIERRIVVETNTYVVTLVNSTPVACTCPDFINHIRTCKHQKSVGENPESYLLAKGKA